MGWNGSGVWSAPSLPGSFNPAIVGQQATAADWNTFLSALSGITGLSNLICKDGQTVPTDNLPMGGFRHTGVGAATALTQYGVVGDVINTGYIYGDDVGAADAYEITLPVAPSAYVKGQTYRTVIANTNLTDAPTFVVTGLATGTIVNGDGSVLTIGVLQAGASALLQVSSVSGSTPTFQLLGVASMPVPVQVLFAYLAGLGTANNVSSPNTEIDVAAGECANDTNVKMMSYAGGTLNCSTTGANGLDTGSLADSTWYHLFVIGKTDGTTALLASTSISSPAFPSGYTLKRRIASFLTDASAHILAYSQKGSKFLWTVPVLDVSGATLGTTATNFTLSVPLGLIVDALFRASGTSGGTSIAIYSPNQSTQTVGNQTGGPNLIIVSGVSGNGSAGNFQIQTDTASHIAAVGNANSSTFQVKTDGWIDTRGRDS